MVRLRIVLAALALLAFAALILTSPPALEAESRRLSVALRLLLVPLALTSLGLARGWTWSRWLGLATGVAVLPWTVALLATPGPGLDRARVWIAAAAALALIGSLAGERMFRHFEGSAGLEWAGRRLSLVRWAIVCNLAAVLNLYVFATAYRPSAAWHSAIPGSLAIGLVLGVWLLARRRTLGLFVLGAGCLLLPPAAWYFVTREASTAAEAWLFAVLLGPGLITALATLASFAAPMWRYSTRR